MEGKKNKDDKLVVQFGEKRKGEKGLSEAEVKDLIKICLIKKH